MKNLLIIDLQKQFADKDNACRNYKRCLEFINDHKSEYDNVIATYFKQDGSNPNYQQHLNWNDCADASENDLEFYDKETWKETIISKSGYGIESVKNILLQTNISKYDQIDIIGCDADACVMAICFQLWDAGFTNMRILTDYIYTSADYEKFGIDKEQWVQSMRRNFGDCVIIPKRRISYDALFLPNSGSKIQYKGKEYDGCVALFFEYQYIGPNGEEWFIASNWNHPNHPYRYSIDKEKGYTVSTKDNYKGLYCVSKPTDEACIWIDDATPVMIPFEDGVQILKDNYFIYDNSNNRPAQNASYSIRILENNSN